MNLLVFPMTVYLQRKHVDKFAARSSWQDLLGFSIIKSDFPTNFTIMKHMATGNGSYRNNQLLPIDLKVEGDFLSLSLN